MGKDRQGHRSIANGKNGELLLKGVISCCSKDRPLIQADQVVTLGETGRHMCEGEFESLKAIFAVSPNFVPKPHAWGKYYKENPETYFLLTEFRDVGQQVRTIPLISFG
jgi:hypothetical protein